MNYVLIDDHINHRFMMICWTWGIEIINIDICHYDYYESSLVSAIMKLSNIEPPGLILNTLNTLPYQSQIVSLSYPHYDCPPLTSTNYQPEL